MTDYIQVSTAIDSEEGAQKIAETLVSAREIDRDWPYGARDSRLAAVDLARQDFDQMMSSYARANPDEHGVIATDVVTAALARAYPCASRLTGQ